MKRFIAIIAAWTLLVLGASGCMPGTDPQGTELHRKTIKVMGSGEQWFYSRYGTLFSALHPEVEFEFIPNTTRSVSELAQFVKERAPDVLILSPAEFEELAYQNLLTELNLFIQKSGYDLEGTVEPVIQHLQQLSGGSMYGLSPVFSSRAIYYNKDLFVRYGIPFPNDGMSWQDLLLLASRFPVSGNAEDRIYGFMHHAYATDPFEFAVTIGASMGLDYVDRTNLTMTLDTPQWRDVFQLVLDTLRSGTVFQGEQPQLGMPYEEMLRTNPFVSGKTAMVFATPDLMATLKNAQSYMDIPEWDLAAAPGGTSGMEVGDIFAIYQGSSQAETSWKFIQYVNSDEYARVYMLNPESGFLPTRKKYLNDENGHHLEAFYRTQPMLARNENRVPQEFYLHFTALAREEFQKAYKGSQTIDETLATLQEAGEGLLLRSFQSAE